MFKREIGSTFSYTGTFRRKLWVTNLLVMTTTHPLKAPNSFRYTEKKPRLKQKTSTRSHARQDTEPRALSAHRERRPLGEASGLRAAFTETSFSFPCGFHSLTTPNTTHTHRTCTESNCVSYLNIIVFTVFRYPRQILVAFHERSFTGRDFLL